jgi:hypothetical protein
VISCAADGTSEFLLDLVWWCRSGAGKPTESLALAAEIEWSSWGPLKIISEIDARHRVSLAGVEVCELFDGTGDQKHVYGLLKKVKLVDKTRNLEMLGRYFKMFKADGDNPDDAMRITTLVIDL